jgi:cell division protein FtsI/penicillin-binding protein 2
MEEGTGRAAQSAKYTMFSKSGTAQLPRKDRKGYHQDRYVSSFIAGAPYIQPRIVVLCVLDDPDRRKGHFGGAIAGPVVRDVIDQTLEYLGVSADQAAKEESTLAKAE